MEIRSGSVFFPRSRGFGPRTANSSPLVFPRQVLRATAGLTGYTAQFLPEDRQLGQFQVRVTPQINSNTVTVAATFGLRDWSGDWDDDYAGTVNFVVLADLEAVTEVPPRRDLAIVDAEFNQVTQFFRSSTFLDPVNIRPDNSVPLIERKPTGVRLYVDFDAAAGLAPIALLSGELEIRSPAGTRVIGPRQSIVPRRDSQVLRAQASHTLNFAIPEELCVGVVTVRARVFSAADPAARSGFFERTIRFVNTPSLRVYLIGVNYTGQGMNLAAPTQAEMTTTLDFTEQVFPTGELLVTGYQVLPFGENMNPGGSSGCGSGFAKLLDRLEDLQGNASDTYFAELPANVNTGNIAGCAREGVASTTNGNGNTSAHEIGHAFGLQHTPCAPCPNPTPPSDPNDDYPQYGSFGRDSIGEFGYDPIADVVFDPATTFDLMAPGRRPRWMSPYNYAKLLFAGGGPTDGGMPFGEVAPHVPIEILRLRLAIHRNRIVEREHSFHFPATRRTRHGHATEYAVEFHDEKGRTLACHSLACSCTQCEHNCYPVVVRSRIPYPINARLMQVWEGRDSMIYEEKIPLPPQVVFTGRKSLKDGLLVEWAPTPEFERIDLRYLVQFEDRPGVWRGVAPRSAKRSLLIPRPFFRRRKPLVVRVLASSGIATGMVVDRFELAPDPTGLREPIDPPLIVVARNGQLTPGHAVGDCLRASGGDNRGLRWYDAAGAELSGSGTLDLQQLPDGQHTLRAVALGGDPLQAVRSLAVEKAGSRVTFLRDLLPAPPPRKIAQLLYDSDSETGQDEEQ